MKELEEKLKVVCNIPNEKKQVRFIVDKDDRIRGTVILYKCPCCGEMKVENIFTDGDIDDLEDYIWKSGFRDYLMGGVDNGW